MIRPTFLVFELLLWSTTIYTLWKGGRSERIAIAILVVAFTLTPFVVTTIWKPFGRFEPGVFLVSCASFAALLWLALRSDKFWPLWLVALQGQVVLSHIAPILGPQVNQFVYQAANGRWGWVQLILVAVATWEHDRYWAAKPAVVT